MKKINPKYYYLLKRLLSFFVIFLFWYIFIYFLVSFVQLTTDASKWSITARFIFVLFGHILGLIISSVLTDKLN